MTSWPILDREPVQLPTLPGHDEALWLALIELTELRPGEWTLVGGQMVFLHAMEHGVTPPRISTDLDVLVNARVVMGGVHEFVRAIEEQGFVLVGASPEGLAHRYVREGEHRRARARRPRTSDRPDHDAPGPNTSDSRRHAGTRSHGAGTRRVRERTRARPSLLGAIISKAVAVDVDDLPDSQRLDLALLLSLVDDPLAMADELTAKDRKRLRTRSEMSDPDERSWASLTPDAADRGRAAYRLLIG